MSIFEFVIFLLVAFLAVIKVYEVLEYRELKKAFEASEEEDCATTDEESVNEVFEDLANDFERCGVTAGTRWTKEDIRRVDEYIKKVERPSEHIMLIKELAFQKSVYIEEDGDADKR